MKDNGRYEKMIILNQNSKIEAEYKSTAVDWAVRNLMSGDASPDGKARGFEGAEPKEK